jgi:hypothetical protein
MPMKHFLFGNLNTDFPNYLNKIVILIFLTNKIEIIFHNLIFYFLILLNYC